VLSTQEAEKQHYDSVSILLTTELAKQRTQERPSRLHAACVALSTGPVQGLMEPKHTQPQCLAVPLA
jgi:hypothetical protein